MFEKEEKGGWGIRVCGKSASESMDSSPDLSLKLRRGSSDSRESFYMDFAQGIDSDIEEVTTIVEPPPPVAPTLAELPPPPELPDVQDVPILGEVVSPPVIAEEDEVILSDVGEDEQEVIEVEEDEIDEGLEIEEENEAEEVVQDLQDAKQEEQTEDFRENSLEIVVDEVKLEDIGDEGDEAQDDNEFIQEEVLEHEGSPEDDTESHTTSLPPAPPTPPPPLTDIDGR